MPKPRSIVVDKLYYYPIKSCRAIEVKTATLGKRGIEFDRMFMIAVWFYISSLLTAQIPKEEQYDFITGRQYPKIALITPSLDLKAKTMTISFESMKPVTVPLYATGEHKAVKARCWGVMCDAFDMGDKVGEFLTTALGVSCRLVRMLDEFVRPTVPESVFMDADPDALVSFADYTQFLLTSNESLDALNKAATSSVPMSRFRSNIVCKGVASPWDEDTWKQIKVGKITLNAATHCTRCKQTTVDINKGEFDRSGEPLLTLRKFRSSPEYGDGVLFGVQLTQDGEGGTISVGDSIEVVQRIHKEVKTGEVIKTKKETKKTETDEKPSTSADQPLFSEGRLKLPTDAKELAQCKSDTGRFCYILLAILVVNIAVVLYAYYYGNNGMSLKN